MTNKEYDRRLREIHISFRNNSINWDEYCEQVAELNEERDQAEDKASPPRKDKND